MTFSAIPPSSPKRMLRTLDGTARALLSDRYRRIDNFEVASAVLPIISRMEGAGVEKPRLIYCRFDRIFQLHQECFVVPTGYRIITMAPSLWRSLTKERV